MRFSELVVQVTKAVRNFEGSIAWHVVACLRELEVQGRVTKHHGPVRYCKNRTRRCFPEIRARPR